MDIQEGYLYSKDHEWISVEGKVATIGITDYAQEALGDITFVELPEEGVIFNKEDSFGVVESVKAVNDCFAPLSGKIIEVNGSLVDGPEVINEDPYNEGWMIRVEVSKNGELDELMNHEAYKEYLENLE